MLGRKNHTHAWKFFLVLFGLLLWTDVASAYIGPGAGLEFAGYFMGLLAWVITAFSATLLWPLYSFLRWMRGARDEKPAEKEKTTGLDSECPL